MKYSGPIHKMETKFGNPVQYTLPVGDAMVDMNGFIGHEVSLKWLNEIHCVCCGKPIKKSFGQGYCYPCFISSPETEDCVLRPEMCRAHEGIARDMEWATKHCLQDHFVYLALSSDIKVGVTRQSQVPIRWIDQGAWKAIKLAKTPNRYTAGLIEVEMKQYIKDKTNWREMLKNVQNTKIDLLAEKHRLSALFSSEVAAFISPDDEICEIEYPVVQYPQKPVSIDLEKISEIKSMLLGIKGQYLIFDHNIVINIRKHGGYIVEVEGL